jgi:hypothetical protein
MQKAPNLRTKGRKPGLFTQKLDVFRLTLTSSPSYADMRHKDQAKKARLVW